ncbi:MAG: aminodeoxychorismate synthase component I [Bacteroidota bacterium]|jgi:para-aminobenzoate synthetase component 1
MSTAEDAIHLMNLYGKQVQPFLFIIDFDCQKPVILRLEETLKNRVLYDIQGFTNVHVPRTVDKILEFQKYPIAFETYKRAFEHVHHHIFYGNTYLLNLTAPTRIETNYTLSDLFFRSTAKFKLIFKDLFIVFSPEIFLRIEDRTISSFPMKGTINAALPHAENKIISDEKERAEHATIVDLIRNDLSMVAANVKVEKYRYIDQIHAHDKELLQVSSKITGQMEENYRERIGDIIFQLLPAGSVSGAPKKKTIEIIKEAEQYERGYYTGVFGYFDGSRLESGVMIRFVENVDGTLYYKSGGGITAYSNAESEYKEMIDKVYVPLA